MEVSLKKKPEEAESAAQGASRRNEMKADSKPTFLVWDQQGRDSEKV